MLSTKSGAAGPTIKPTAEASTKLDIGPPAGHHLTFLLEHQLLACGLQCEDL